MATLRLIERVEISPTKRKFYKTEKIDDIIDPSFRAAGDENCYIFEHLTPPNFL